MSYVETEGEKGREEALLSGIYVGHLDHAIPPSLCALSYQQARSREDDRERQMTIIMGCGGRERQTMAMTAAMAAAADNRRARRLHAWPPPSSSPGGRGD